MADPTYRVELTASFLERLDAIEAFLVAADAGFAFDDLLADRAGVRLAELATATERQARVMQQRMSVPLSENDFMPAM